MLSILIPVYKFDCRIFILELHKQVSDCKIDFEILVYDDGSNPEIKEINNSVSQLSNVIYKELPANIGRSKIRNKMAADANFNNLLFLDCDSKISSKKFISDYIKHCDNKSVIYGGRCYETSEPADKSTYLRWYYGIKRETISVETRLKNNPYKSFMTNNFLIPKEIFNSIKLNENLTGYGHEDTLFGAKLKENNVPIIHIDNPLCHIGLESADEFLKKTLEGLKNLFLISENGYDGDEIKLLNYYKIIKKFYLKKIILFVYSIFENRIINNLKSSHPNLFWFDFYKLNYLIIFSEKK